MPNYNYHFIYLIIINKKLFTASTILIVCLHISAMLHLWWWIPSMDHCNCVQNHRWLLANFICLYQNWIPLHGCALLSASLSIIMHIGGGRTRTGTGCLQNILNLNFWFLKINFFLVYLLEIIFPNSIPLKKLV